MTIAYPVPVPYIRLNLSVTSHKSLPSHSQRVDSNFLIIDTLRLGIGRSAGRTTGTGFERNFVFEIIKSIDTDGA